MTDLLVYNLKAGFILAILYLLYVLLLRKETFYGFNRTFLLFALFTAFLLPSLNISMDISNPQKENTFAYIDHTFEEVSQTLTYVELETVKSVNSFPIIPMLLLLGMCIATFRVGVQLASIYKNINKYGIKIQGKYKYVLMDKHHTTHSFFNFIFVQKSDYKDGLKKEMLLHEQIHADKLHSLDLLAVGFLSILQWFNPFIYLFKRALTETHEFQADRALLDQGTDKIHYQQLLLGQARSIVFAGLTSNFNQSLIRNRLKMMNKVRSSNKMVIKYLMAAPVVFVLSAFIACSQDKIESSLDNLVQNENGINTLNFGDEKLSYRANDSIKIEKDITALFGDANVETLYAGLKADLIYINWNKKKAYAYFEDDIPSFYPVAKEKLKRPTTGFGMMMHPILKVKKMHSGMDFAAPVGTEIMATADGIVRSAEYPKTNKSYGNRVIIDHGDIFSTSYSHMQKYIVEVGQSVVKGEIIGYVGSTGLSKGPHLHYEIMKNGKYVDPQDYLDIQQDNMEGSMD